MASMFTKGFKVTGSSLALMRPGERGIVTQFKNASESITETLMDMGIMPGTAITLEQRFPRFVIQAGSHRLSLNECMIRSIYVRLAE